LQELEDDPNAAIEIAEDMREEGEEFGTVTNVVVYDKEPDGIVTVRFEDTEAATKFVEKCHGRFFDNRRLDVRPATENPKGKFKKSDRYVDEEEQEKHLNSLVQE
jgi:HIV Tat-specific factor 1